MIAIFTAFLLLTSRENTVAQVPLVIDGEAQAAIVLRAQPEEREEEAAEELRKHVKLISGATLQVVTNHNVPDGKLPIYLGASADESLDQLTRSKKDNPSSFALRVASDRIDIRGLSGEGTLFGVYELLEQMGVRWYHPGDLGRVVPSTTTVRVKKQRTIQAPSMDYRVLQHIRSGAWRHRARLGGQPRATGSHGIPPFSPGRSGRKWFKSNPEYFALIDGERRFKQICASNRGAVARTVEVIRERYEPTTETIYVGMGPNDGGGYCQCQDCQALDGDVYDPLRGQDAVTGRYIWFFNQVLAALEDDYPNLHITWYVYARHMMPPPPELEPNPRIIPVFAPITLDRVHSMDNPMSPDRHILRWLIDEWSKTNPNQMYFRGYYNNLACPQFPFSQVDRIRHETPAFHRSGINVMRVEVIDRGPSWSAHTPHLYLAARLMWDVNTDVDALLEEFYTKFYGPAREPMKQYHEALDRAFHDTPYFTGSSYVYFPIFMDHPRRESIRAMLDQAASLVEKGTIYAERIWSVRTAWNRLETFLDMIDDRNHFDFAAAHEKIKKFNRLSDELVNYVLEGEEADRRDAMRLLTWHSRSDNPSSMFNRFFAQSIVSGYRRAEQFGEIVATLPDEWNFLLDPTEIGEISGYFRPGKLGGNWQPLKTKTRSWSDQGLHYYKGVAWYRTRVRIPQKYEGRPLYLWFGGVDEIAHVWINGRSVGTSSEPAAGLPGAPGAFQPFDVPATEAANFGEENWVVVKIENRILNELGTGGIIGPVMFWTPHDENWSPGGESLESHE